MTFTVEYPYISQWVTYHGKMTIAQVVDNKIEVALADAGGVPEDGRFYGSTVDEALIKANQALPEWLKGTKQLLDDLVSGELKSTECEFICVAGWPPVRNPFYEPTA